MQFITRSAHPRSVWALEQAGVHPLLAQLYAARGVSSPTELDDALGLLQPPDTLKGVGQAAHLLADAIAAGERLCVVADYDCDGATACACALRGLRMLGAADVTYWVPDRARDGYGLTPPIAQRVADNGAHWLITVDNGIASFEGVAAARALGLRVLITDHHLCANDAQGQPQLPQADAIVNPQQPGCAFASKALCGVGVVFYLLLALRAELRARGRLAAAQQPRLDTLLPLVALGTVADVVTLDANNRRLVAQGLKRIRSGAAPAGLLALLAAAGREVARACSQDLGFALAPRINAAGRLADMTTGIECLLTDDAARAQQLAQQLDAINRERREVEGAMREAALAKTDALLADAGQLPAALCLADPDFHEGVVGIVAGRLKDRFHRPTFVFAPGQDGTLKGSGRSIAGFHLRDALDAVAKRAPGVLLRFGGHAMAAGCTLRADALPAFQAALLSVAQAQLDAATLTQQLLTDGPLAAVHRRTDVAELLQQGVWGPGFAAPLFADDFVVQGQRLVGSGHLALQLRLAGEPLEAMWFGRSAPLGDRARLAYRLEVDRWKGQERLRLFVEAAEDPA